jgi:hypothetical protein
MRIDRSHVLLVALLCIGCSVFASSSLQQPFKCSSTNDVDACNALGQLYYSTNGPNSWQVAQGWADAAASERPTDYCSFFGVMCAGQVDIPINAWNDYAHTTSTSSSHFPGPQEPLGTIISL